MVSKSKVAGTHGMPEGAEMVLSSFGVEVGPVVEAQRFRCDICLFRHVGSTNHVCMHACMHDPAADLPPLPPHARAGLALASANRQHCLHG